MARKKSSMQKEVEKTENAFLPGEQMPLMDTKPENAEEIIQYARLYKKAQVNRIKCLDEEKAAKQKILDLVNAAHLQRLEGGKIKFKLDGYIITITPRDELVQIIEDVD